MRSRKPLMPNRSAPSSSRCCQATGATASFTVSSLYDVLEEKFVEGGEYEALPGNQQTLRNYVAYLRGRGIVACEPKNQRVYDHVFGTITLECDLDLDPGTVYKAYSSRWEIEIVMRYYKSACEFDETRVHDDYSVIGSEFCDFLSTVMTFRMLGAFDTARLLERMPYKKVMAALARAKKIRLAGDDWKLGKINPSQERILQELGLLEVPDTPPKRKRGRPRKSPV